MNSPVKTPQEAQSLNFHETRLRRLACGMATLVEIRRVRREWRVGAVWICGSGTGTTVSSIGESNEAGVDASSVE